MNRLNRLALACFSVLLLLGVIGANAASASEFEAESYPAHLEGAQVSGEPFILETEAGTLECATFTATGEQSANAESVELSPAAAECKAFGFLGVGIHFNGCKLRPRAGGNIASHKWNATVDVVCPVNKAILVTAATCEFDIPSQNGIGGVTLDVETSFPNPAIKFTFNSTITVNVTKDGFGCPFSGTGHKKGTWKGSIRISAWDILKKVIIKWWVK